MSLDNKQRLALNSFLSTHSEMLVPGKEAKLATLFRDSILSLGELETIMAKEIKQREAEKVREADRQQRRFTVLFPPPSKERYEVIGIGPNGEKQLKEVMRQAVTVSVRNLDAFCKENRLNAKEVMKVAMGEIREYKGWTRADMFCPLNNDLCIGHPWTPPPAPRKKNTWVVDPAPVVQIQQGYYKQPIDYVPGQDK